jgi:hypothetical protein
MSDKNPEHLERTTREHFNQLCAAFRNATNGDYFLEVRETWRSSADQDAALARGASALGRGRSKHGIEAPDGTKRSHAVDAVVRDARSGAYLTGKTLADFALYTIAGEIWERYGGRWGGRWKQPCDPGHFEAPGKVVDLWAGTPPRWTQ